MRALSGQLTITCETDEEYAASLAEVQANATCSIVSQDPVARSITFNVNEDIT